MSSLKKTLSIIREKSKNDIEMGFAFERLSKVFFENDSTQTQQYSKVWHFSDWAKDREEYSNIDIGIDLVAKLREEDGFCAIQCKFYQSNYSISKADLDSFISASASSDFKRLVLIDTSSQPIGKNAQKVFDNLTQEYVRIQFNEIEQSRIDWSSYIDDGSINLKKKKDLLDHQIDAVNAIKSGLEKEDRGKMIMACGTGKTFTSLRIAEEIVGNRGAILYMVPSLALMSQTIREWKNDSSYEFLAYSVCSDQKVGKKKSLDDQINISLNDLAFPATTDPYKLSEKIERADQSMMKVVFSTYQSIDVISKSQTEFNLSEFDLIICDEAHRTTGATLVGDDESNFVKIHDNEHIKGKKRLYMTATPRIYGETAKRREDEGEVNLASMDNEEIFGKNLFYRSFGWAVENNLLTDYKVVVLMMDEQIVSDRVQQRFSEGAELELDDVTKMVGCYKALAKVGINMNSEGFVGDKSYMKRALAFCQNIRTSELFSSEFSSVVNEYIANEEVSKANKVDLEVELFHVDGTFNAEQRNEKLSWLKEKTDDNICRVLSNARCLSEGVDVPSLDAIMFLHPRRSQIDVVQSVGRVMRKAEGKNLGYVILPITVAPGVSAEKALNENERYEVVWQILNALRAHDERFDSTINRIGLGEDVSNRLEIIDGTSTSELEATTSVVEDVRPRSNRQENNNENTNLGDEDDSVDSTGGEAEQLSFTLTDLSQAMKARIVEKCGTRDYWEKWAGDIAVIAQKHITHINSLVLNSGTKERDSFMNFLEEIRDDLNPDITETDAVEMLAQHIITRPVFDALFKGNLFTRENAVSKAMEKVLSQIYEKNIDNETRSLKRFYESVKRRAADINTSKGRQKLIIELYDRFFQNAFPLMTKRLGIVYTPVEIVDFIINSAEDLMREEFSSSLGDENVHILDPFTGTGTFITRLLNSKILSKEQVLRKFNSEIHANEIVLLAYYIACINIEAIYYDLFEEENYVPFTGLVLTDTFQLFEQERDMIANLLPDNSQRRTEQKNKKIKIIIGNPPYSIGQKLESDNAANISYSCLDKRIGETFAKNSKSQLLKGLYDSYIRAFRWAIDRIGEEGIIGFVSGAGWVDRNFADGMRRDLELTFDKIYVINLRGDIRKNMLSGKTAGEGENVFGQGSMTGISITLLIKKRNSKRGEIKYFDIGDNKTRDEKLSLLMTMQSIGEMEKLNKFDLIKPNCNYEWINQGDMMFETLDYLGNKSNDTKSIFSLYSLGLSSNRDAWCFNFSKSKLERNIIKLISNYNSQIDKSNYSNTKYTLPTDSKKYSWTKNLKDRFNKRRKIEYNEKSLITSLYRPFTKTNLYFSRDLNERVFQHHRIFPSKDSKNKLIVISGVGARAGFSCLMTDCLPCLDMIEKGQCFPLYNYSEELDNKKNIFNQNSIFKEDSNNSQENICSEYLNRVQKKLDCSDVTNEDIFYYVYGILHSKDYRERFKNNISKSLARIPIVKNKDEFFKFSKSGKELGLMHINFEEVELHPCDFKEGDIRLLYIDDPQKFYQVEKMKFPNKSDKSIISYNKNLTLQNVPLEVYEYVINGKSAVEWVMERQSVSIHKATGIKNDANDYANATMENPAYPLELLRRIITVSLETMKIIKSLPKLNID